jgi:hypothetical protein
MAQVQVFIHIYRNLSQNQKRRLSNRLPNSQQNNKLKNKKLKKNKNKLNQILLLAILQMKLKLLNLWVWGFQENNAFKRCEPHSIMLKGLFNIYSMGFLPIYAICHPKINSNSHKRQKKEDSN